MRTIHRLVILAGNRARYLIFVILQEAGINVKVRSVVATQGKLPEKGDAKAAVKYVIQLPGYTLGLSPPGWT